MFKPFPDRIKIEDINQLEAWRYILGFFVGLKENFCNPFRPDRKPNAFLKEHNGRIFLTDWADISFNSWDCVKAYSHIKNITRRSSLEELYSLLNLERKIYPSKKEMVLNETLCSQGTDIQIEKRYFVQKDREFWEKRGISKNQLVEDNVIPVRYMWINGIKFIPKSLCYAYYFPLTEHYKIYQPFETGKFKWVSNVKKDEYWCWEGNDNLLITKSYKDGRILRNTIDWTVIALQNEGMIPNKKIIADLIEHHPNRLILFDNDTAGKRAAEKVREVFQCSSIEIPEEYGKDSDDFYIKDNLAFQTWVNTVLI